MIKFKRFNYSDRSGKRRAPLPLSLDRYLLTRASKSVSFC